MDRGARKAASPWPPIRMGTGLGGGRRHLHRRDVEDLAVVLEEAARGESPDDVDCTRSLRVAPVLPGYVEEVVVLGPRARPHPKRKRFSVSTATDDACLATITGWRMGSFTTNVTNRSVVVTAPGPG